MRTFRKSGGTLCTAPGEIAFLLTDFILLRYAVVWESSDACHILLLVRLYGSRGARGIEVPASQDYHRPDLARNTGC
jgi:hypothetical protein